MSGVCAYPRCPRPAARSGVCLAHMHRAGWCRCGSCQARWSSARLADGGGGGDGGGAAWHEREIRGCTVRSTDPALLDAMERYCGGGHD